MIAHLTNFINDKSNVGKVIDGYEVALADNFEYKDPIDGSVSKNQVRGRTDCKSSSVCSSCIYFRVFALSLKMAPESFSV